MTLLVAATVAALAGCADRTVREAPEPIEAFRTKGLAATIPNAPATLAAVEMRGEDPLRPFGGRNQYLIWLPLWPYATSGDAVVRANEIGPEIERAIWPRFRNAPADRPVVLRVTVEEGRVEEVRTLYGLSIAGLLVSAVLGPPLKYMEGRVAARFALVDPAAAPDAKPIFERRLAASVRARAGVAGLFYWYNTDVKPRDLVFEAWARVLEDLARALPAALSGGPAAAGSPPAPGPR